MGFSLLAYSMYVFFFTAPEIPKAAVEPALERAPNPIPLPEPPKITQLDRTAEPTDTFARDLREAARKPAEKYLQRVGMQMEIPEDHRYREAKDGAVDILIGTNASGKEALYLFSFKKKYERSRTEKYLKSYFQDVADYKTKGGAQKYRGRGGVKEMALFKGVNSDGEEFQAYGFQNSKTGGAHILLLKEKGLSRQPAKVRLIVDSVSPGAPAR